MVNTVSPRAVFVALVQRTGAAAKVSLPPLGPPDQPLTVPLDIDHVRFELCHAAKDAKDFTVMAHFGKPTPARRADVLTRALRVNGPLARAHVASFGFDAASGQLVYTTRDHVSEIEAPALAAAMSKIAMGVSQWRTAGLVSA